MIGEIVINGRSSKDFNVYLSDAGIYGMPEKDTTSIEVKGRSGNLVIDNKRYKNKETRFPCLIVEGFANNFTEFIAYLLNQEGYAKIETSFFPNEYIMGRFIGETDPKLTDDSKFGRFEITFDRKPQRYIKSGNMPITFNSSGSLYNEYSGKALPIVRVYGIGVVAINDVTITINSVDSYVDIDCELQDAYKGTTNCNGNISLTTGSFFELKPGINNISFANTISKIEIVPRWWKLWSQLFFMKKIQQAF